MRHIQYRPLKKHWKYVLGETYSMLTSIKPPRLVKTPYIRLTKTGKLTISADYAWDGPSGPMRDDDTNMRGSLVHDVLYQLMRMRRLNHKKWQEPADALFRDMCLADGMQRRRARRAYRALQAFGDSSCKPQSGDRVVWYISPG